MTTTVRSSPITTRDYSLTVGTTAVTAFTPAQLPGGIVQMMRIYNVSPTATVWCSRAGVAAANAAGSFPIGPLNYELWVAPGPVPQNTLSIVATAPSTPVTIEVG
jgi:hypothetical protein